MEVSSVSEKEARITKIIADVSYVKAKERYETFTFTGGRSGAQVFRSDRICINQSFKGRNLTAETMKSKLSESRS